MSIGGFGYSDEAKALSLLVLAVLAYSCYWL